MKVKATNYREFAIFGKRLTAFSVFSYQLKSKSEDK